MMHETIRLDRLRSHASVCAPYAFLIGYTAALLLPTYGQHRLYWGDLLFYFEPMYGFAKMKLVTGLLPLWNPYVLCGQPYIGNPQTSIFYPMSLLLPLTRSWDFILASDTCHLFLCGAATYLYLTNWTQSRFAALCGAVVFEGSGTVLGRLQFPPMIAAMGYIPLVLAMVDRVLRRRSPWNSCALTLSIALILLAGHPQMAYFGLSTATVYTLASVWATRRPATDRSNLILLQLAGCLGAGITLAAVQLLPTAQLVLASPREEMTVQQANRFVLQPDHLITLILPHFNGAPASADYWLDGNAWEPEIFIGWAPLGLAVYALTPRRRRRCAVFWFGVCVVATWLAIGNVGGLYWLAFHVVPGVAAFHDPARFLILSTFGLASLTAFGIDGLPNLPFRSRQYSTIAIGFVVLAPILLYSADWLPTANIGDLDHRPAVLTVLSPAAISTGRLYEPDHQQFWRQYVTAGYSDYGPRNPQGIRFEIDTLLPNLSMRYRVPSASGYEPVPLSGPSALDGLSRVALHRNEPNFANLLDLLQVRWLALPETERMMSPSLLQTQAPGTHTHLLRVYRKHGLLPEAWIVHDERLVDGTMRLAAAIAAPDFNPYRTAIVSGCSVVREKVSFTSVIQKRYPGSGVVNTSVSDLRRQFRVNSGPSEGLLVIAFAAYPGWSASVDGRSVHTCRADGALLAVPVPSGEHEVVLQYQPQTFQVGLYLSLVGLAGLLAFVSFHSIRCQPRRWSHPIVTIGRLA